MYFKIENKFLYNNLLVASKAISSAAPHPALSGIKISAFDNYLELTASDSNISIKQNINKTENNNLEIIEKGGVVIDAKYLLEIIKKINGDIIKFETIDGGYTQISSGKTIFKINGLKDSEYPLIDFSINNNFFEINPEYLIDIVNKTSFAISESGTKPALTGVNLKNINNTLIATATDSYRLATKKIEIDLNQNFNITIPAKPLRDIYQIILEEDNIKLAIDSKKMQVKTENTLIQTRLIDDAYPDTSKLITDNFNIKATINTKELAAAIDRTLFIRQEGKNIVKLNINAGEINIYSSNQEIGSYDEKINLINHEGENIEISCSGKYLLDALKSFEESEITLFINGPLKPIIIKNNNDDKLIQLVSPIRPYN